LRHIGKQKQRKIILKLWNKRKKDSTKSRKTPKKKTVEKYGKDKQKKEKKTEIKKKRKETYRVKKTKKEYGERQSNEIWNVEKGSKEKTLIRRICRVFIYSTYSSSKSILYWVKRKKKEYRKTHRDER